MTDGVKESVFKCPECRSRKLSRDAGKGEMVCQDCGLVVEESMIQEGHDWRAFDADQYAKRAHTGAPLKASDPKKGLVTEIDRYDRDSSGTKLDANRKQDFYRMRKWHRRASGSPVERNLGIALSELNRLTSRMSLGDSIREASAQLYRKCIEKDLIRGRQIEVVVSAVVYAVCRIHGVPRTLEEVSKESELPVREIGRAYRLITSELELKVPLTNPQFYVTRFVNTLRLGGGTEEKAKEILNRAIEARLLSGRGPVGVAAAAVYIACILEGERRTQKEIADVAGVTEVTIRNRYREIKNTLDIKVVI